MARKVQDNSKKTNQKARIPIKRKINSKKKLSVKNNRTKLLTMLAIKRKYYQKKIKNYVINRLLGNILRNSDKLIQCS